MTSREVDAVRCIDDWYKDNKQELLRRWHEYGKHADEADLEEFLRYEYNIAEGQDL